MNVEGSCHCGQVVYRGEIDPAQVSLCNCTDCQMLTGSAFRVSVPAPKQQFQLLSGQLKTYIKTAESGAKRIHAFCVDWRNAGLCLCKCRGPANVFVARWLLTAARSVATEETHLVQVGA